MDKLGFFAAPGRYVQGREATAQLGNLLQKLAIPSPVLILASKASVERDWVEAVRHANSKRCQQGLPLAG